MKVVSAPRFRHVLSVARDKDGREHHLIVVKSTYDLPRNSVDPVVATAPRDVVMADVYNGDPGTSSLREGHDLPLFKALVDFIVVGTARSPHGQPVRSLQVRLSVGSTIDKTVTVIGDRRWQRSLLGGMVPSDPEPFTEMPLRYERAFGGGFTAQDNPGSGAFHRENLVGVGWYHKLPAKQFEGTLLPNLMPPGASIRSWGEATRTCGFASISPNWSPRMEFAGTYDESWLSERYPLLPEDFDYRFEQSAPVDQRLARIKGGQIVRIDNVAHDEALQFRLPSLALPVTFLVKDEPDIIFEKYPDTVIVWSDERQLTMTWRASLPVRTKLYALRKVVVGEKSKYWFAMQRGPKPVYAGLDELIKAKRLQ